MANPPRGFSRKAREARLLALLPEGKSKRARFSVLALADQRLIEVLFAACELDQSPAYCLRHLSEAELAYLEACCADPSYLRPFSVFRTS